jgi:hypothetical protein
MVEKCINIYSLTDLSKLKKMEYIILMNLLKMTPNNLFFTKVIFFIIFSIVLTILIKLKKKYQIEITWRKI